MEKISAAQKQAQIEAELDLIKVKKEAAGLTANLRATAKQIE